MKGVINIDFVVSILIFLSTISFVSVSIVNNLPIFHHESLSDTLKARSYQISHLFLFDEGFPSNWDMNTVQRIGLSEDPYILDRDKIDELNALCLSDYERVRALLIDYKRDVIIEMRSSENPEQDPILSCGDVKTNIRPEFIIKRFAMVDDEAFEMKITVV